MLRDKILNAPAELTSLVAVEVPEWQTSVYLRPMTASRRDRFEQAVAKDPGNNTRARLAAYSICDEKGVFQFSEADIPALGEQPASALDRIFPAAMKINRIGTNDIDELEKNS